MQSLNSGYSPAFFPVSDNDWANDQAIMEASRRLSRTHSSQRGNSMRICKPSSANNSPGTSGPRRTLASDVQTYRKLQLPHSNGSRPARPVSWHPSSQMFTPPAIPEQPAFHPFAPTMYTEQQELSGAYPDISPVLASYSNNTSPCSPFSPLPLASYQNYTPQYLAQTPWELPPPASQYPHFTEAVPALTHAPSLDTPASNMDWSSYMHHGLSNTSPPTPDSFVCLPSSQPTVSEETVPFEALDKPEDEEEGEILVGMGLYDTPDKYEEDPQLNNYWSTAGSLGAPYRKESTGKGLKLEETWVPPQSDDDDEDAESDEDEDEVPQKSTTTTAC